MAEKDLNQIWQFIKELLHEHDCVIVPGFGGFVGNREPARIDQVSHIITPPAKRIIFNQNLKTNDGLLANKVSNVLQINYSDAVELIRQLTEQIKEILQHQKHYEVREFGNFRLNADANYVFLPERHHTYLPASFGLAPFQAEPVSARSAKIGKARIFKDRKELKKVRSKTNIWPKALVAVLAFLLCINGWIFLQDHQLSDLRPDDMQLSVTSWFDSLFNDTAEQKPVAVTEANQPTEPLKETPAVVQTDEMETVDSATFIIQTSEQPILEEPVINENPDAEIDYYSHAENIVLARPKWVFPPSEIFNTSKLEADSLAAKNEEMIEPVATMQPTEPGNEPTTKKMPSNKLAGKSASVDSVYFIIGGVFCKERNAIKYYNQLKEKGYNPEMLLNHTINCQRVSYARFRTRKEAEMMLMNIKTSENPGAWILSQGGKR